MPPSPRLSARMTNSTYLRATTMMIDHSTSEAMPSTLAGVTATPCSGLKHS